MSLGQHLEELRWRVLKCLFAMGAAFILCFAFRNQLRPILLRPHVLAMRALELDTMLKFSTYFESVVAQLKACLVVALVLTSPYVIYQAWAFVAPGLFPRERYKAVRLGLASMACFAAGVAFAYFAFIPVALRYLAALAGGWAEPMLMIGSYFSALFFLSIGLGVAFQTPVVVFCLIRWGVLDPKSLQRHRRAVILGAFVLGAILTPGPDVVTQFMMSITLLVLYDLGGLLAAPSRQAVVGSLRFTGALLAVLAALGAWYAFWPVATASALKGTLTVGKTFVVPGRTARVTRGKVCRTPAGSVARLAFGGAEGPAVYLAGGTALHVHGPTSLSLYSGEMLVVNPNGTRDLAVHTSPATASVAGARASLSAPDADTLKVTVFEGTVQVKAGGQLRHVAAGQTATFRRGGEPADLSEAEQHWADLIGQPQGSGQSIAP
jgi:sec-independent protein translocase protein TatC